VFYLIWLFHLFQDSRQILKKNNLDQRTEEQAKICQNCHPSNITTTKKIHNLLFLYTCVLAYKNQKVFNDFWLCNLGKRSKFMLSKHWGSKFTEIIILKSKIVCYFYNCIKKIYEYLQVVYYFINFYQHSLSCEKYLCKIFCDLGWNCLTIR